MQLIIPSILNFLEEFILNILQKKKQKINSRKFCQIEEPKMIQAGCMFIQYSSPEENDRNKSKIGGLS